MKGVFFVRESKENTVPEREMSRGAERGHARGSSAKDSVRENRVSPFRPTARFDWLPFQQPIGISGFSYWRLGRQGLGKA